MILKYKRTRINAVEPRRAHQDDAGLDLAPVEHCNLEPGRTVKLGTGIAVEIPTGHVGIIVPRSSAKLRGLEALGIIDSQYRGELSLAITNVGDSWQTIEREAYLVQMLIVPCVSPTLELAEELAPSVRGENGFGSSDRKGGNGG
jgi:dUTP pyrophosphatase